MTTALIPLNDRSPMPFGKYRGRCLGEVPAIYLLWLYNQGVSHNGVKNYITANLDILQREVAKIPQR